MDTELTSARGSRLALHGVADSSWAATTRNFVHNVTIPGNAVAKVMIPGSKPTDITEGGKALGPECKVLGVVEVNRISYVAIRVGSGMYSFASTWAS